MTEAKFRFIREDGTVDSVMPEEWQWVAHYTDGTILRQFDYETQMFHQFKEIRQDILATFEMISPAPVQTPPVIIQWALGRKLIHFYRHVHLDVKTPTERYYKLYCVGYETTSEKVILVIMPDGAIIVTNNVDTIEVE
jgi:hypothetical protein